MLSDSAIRSGFFPVWVKGKTDGETIKQAMVYESLAAKNSLCVSFNLYITMDQLTLKLFSAEKTGRGSKYRLYTMGVEK